VPGAASQGGTSSGGSYSASVGGAGQNIGASDGNFNAAFGSVPPDNDRSAAPRRTDFADSSQPQPGMYQDPGPSRHVTDQHVHEKDQNSNDQDLSASRGKDWALRNKPGRAVPVRRTIRVVVRHDHLAILTDDAPLLANPAAGKTIPLQGDTVQSLDAFVAEVRKLIDDWGIAGENLYWRPVLVLSVAPDGQQRAADLARLLKNSGLELSTDEVAHTTSQGNTR
jgi:hypothetical protein